MEILRIRNKKNIKLIQANTVAKTYEDWKVIFKNVERFYNLYKPLSDFIHDKSKSVL